MEPEGCGDGTCPDCGGPLDSFSDLLAGFSEVAEGHDMADVIEALCFMLGNVLAREPAETRPKLRRQVNALIGKTTKYHVVQNCDA
jgi:hypothetical protein